MNETSTQRAWRPSTRGENGQLRNPDRKEKATTENSSCPRYIAISGPDNDYVESGADLPELSSSCGSY
jgi:hypothetical protein